MAKKRGKIKCSYMAKRASNGRMMYFKKCGKEGKKRLIKKAVYLAHKR